MLGERLKRLETYEIQGKIPRKASNPGRRLPISAFATSEVKSSKQGVRMIDQADLMEHLREWDGKWLEGSNDQMISNVFKSAFPWQIASQNQLHMPYRGSEGEFTAPNPSVRQPFWRPTQVRPDLLGPGPPAEGLLHQRCGPGELRRALRGRVCPEGAEPFISNYI